MEPVVKKPLALILTMAFILGTAAGAVGAALTRTIEVTYRDIKINVDGKAIQTPNKPFIVNAEGRTYLPARPLAEALGARVGWDEASGTVLVYSSSYSLETDSGDFKVLRYPAKGFGLTYPRTYTKLQPGLAGAALTLQKNLTTVSVTPSPAPGTDLETWAAFTVTMMESLFSGFKTIGQQKIKAYGVDVIEVTGEYNLAGSALILKMRLFAKDGQAWVITASAEKSAYENQKSELYGIMESFGTIQ